MLKPFAVLSAALLVIVAIVASALAQSLPSQTSDAAGVRVVVTPKALTPPLWEFEVVMDTHSKALTEDLVAIAALFDDRGMIYNAAAWKGDLPGGHHRKGVLQFRAPAIRPAVVDLKLQSVGGTGPHAFRWTLQ
jgi:hypothetical protein